MRIFIASLVTETNTFSPIPTSLRSFTNLDYSRRDGSLGPDRGSSRALQEWRRAAEQGGHEIVESISTYAQPAGTTVRAAYEELRDYILDDLSKAQPVDVVLLDLHGAMIADGYDDCEGDLITRTRAVVGPDVMIGVELDLHCHLTEAMVAGADIVVTYKEYPHTDIRECAREVYGLTMAASQGTLKPVKAVHDCRMIGLWPTTREPVRSFVERMRALEGKNGIASVSLIHGFPWGDVADVGAKVLVIANGDQAQAEALARQLGAEFWAMREEARTPYLTVDEALARVRANSAKAPIVLADVADNAGGGAASDSTAILQRVLDLGLREIALGCFWDPVAVQMCFGAGIGATLALRIGGKVGEHSGQPVDVLATVRGLCPDHKQPGNSGSQWPLGPSAYIETRGVHIILSTIREQVFSPELFTDIGCAMSDKRGVVVKSSQHFYNSFEPIAAEIHYVAASGPISPDFTQIPYTKVQRPLWPRSEA
ncbi:microcystin LR degradation protein MlrC-like protein [Microvirga vignae]|uniref:Microcystinase C n=1 Tax=Microvirga vignae TaxID=1225564 RepID=A0A0H1R3E4_9HYPH|nr:M81 family metallopeptidase [Microvirga vignae]KLK89740.1 microcystin LR degradation protein MlrC-like protein [Microvirga vignae]